jgi:hypothetical protein
MQPKTREQATSKTFPDIQEKLSHEIESNP